MVSVFLPSLFFYEFQLVIQSGFVSIGFFFTQACTVRKMGLILRSIERMLKMQFSIARNFTLQPLRRYDVKTPEKTEQA
jgi:hypothetical protein